MVLEALLYPFKAEKKPWEMFFIGLLYCIVAAFLALWIFDKQASFVTVFLIVLASIPLLYNTLKYEESKDLELDSEKKIMKEHNRAILIFSFWFLGVTVGGVLLYIFLPSNTVNILFQQQMSTIVEINNRTSGNVTGFATSTTIFFKILFNNLKVLIFCLLFAFVYGAGAVFILAWNATVISTAIGNFIRSNLTGIASQVGLSKVTSYFSIISLGFLKYTVHGIPEILAYFYAGIVGGIISIAVAKGHFSSEKSSVLLLDIGELLLIALGFLIIGAIFEVYVTPVLF